MPSVLVVDDSPLDRRIIERLLEENAGLDWIVDFAENGVRALSKLEDLVPDVVVTDLQMPEMDGLELVSEIGTNYPSLPVILITGQGSESIAIEALEKGAASYVPKDRVAERLMDTIEHVIAAVPAKETRQQLSDCITGVEVHLLLDNDIELLRTVVEYLQDALANIGFGDQTTRLHVGIALEEAIFNAMFHGNLELPAEEVRTGRDQANLDNFQAAVAQRKSEAEYGKRRVAIDAHLKPSEARFVIRDEGPGFSPDLIPAPGDPDMLQQSAGRGLVLMRNFMDDVQYNATSRELVLTKGSK